LPIDGYSFSARCGQLSHKDASLKLFFGEASLYTTTPCTVGAPPKMKRDSASVILAVAEGKKSVYCMQRVAGDRSNPEREQQA
jgi:hypothetical protein